MSKEINPRIRTIGDALKAHIERDQATGVGTASEDYEKTALSFLPPELNAEHAPLFQDFFIDVAAAQTLAFGELSTDDMKKNGELKSTSLKTKIGHFGYETTFERERSGTAMGKAWKKQGIANTDVIIGQGRRRSDYKTVVSYLGDNAASVFGN